MMHMRTYVNTLTVALLLTIYVVSAQDQDFDPDRFTERMPKASSRTFYADLQADDHNIHYVNANIGSQRQSIRLWPSLFDGQVSVITTESGLMAPNAFDPKKSSSFEKLSNQIVTQDQYVGNDIRDEIAFDFQDATTTVFKTELLGITTVKSGEKKFTQNKTDGSLGLAPIDKNRHTNFLYQLYRDQYVDQMIFSVYMKMSDRRDSHIKFGGFDEEGALNSVTGNPDFKFIRTTDKDTWRLKMRSAGLYMNRNDFGERYVQFELAYPYIYIPMDDFSELAENINTKYARPLCQAQSGYCQFKTPCDQIEKGAGYLNITVTDSAHRIFHLSLNADNMFLDSSHAKLPQGINCFIPIFGQRTSTNKTWFLGEFMMTQYYQIYDMSQLDEHGYLQIGIGAANQEDLIGKKLLDKHRDAEQQSKAVTVLIISIIFGLAVLAFFVIVHEKKLKKRGKIDVVNNFINPENGGQIRMDISYQPGHGYNDDSMSQRLMNNNINNNYVHQNLQNFRQNVENSSNGQNNYGGVTSTDETRVDGRSGDDGGMQFAMGDDKNQINTSSRNSQNQRAPNQASPYLNSMNINQSFNQSIDQSFNQSNQSIDEKDQY